MPDSSPNCWLLIANSLFMVNAANPMLIRSTKLMTKRMNTNGMMFVRSLRIVVAWIVLGASAGLALTQHPRTDRHSVAPNLTPEWAIPMHEIDLNNLLAYVLGREGVRQE